MTYVILIAGGVGNRLGAGIPKQFVEVLGKPVIAYTMSVLQNCSEIDRIEVVCVDGYQDKLQKIVDDNNISKVFKIVTGGKEYENSIMNGVTGLAGIAKNEDVIMVQWAASPFVTDEILKDNIRVCKEKGNAMSACPAYLLYGSNDGKQANHLHVRVSDSSTKVVFIKDTPNSKYYRGGLWIDVFPIDNVSDKKDGFIKHVILVKIFTGLQMIGEIGGWDLFRRIMHIPMKPFSKWLGKIAQIIMIHYNDKNTHTVANLAVRYRYKSFPPFPHEFMCKFTNVEFEGHTFKAIKQYDVF